MPVRRRHHARIAAAFWLLAAAWACANFGPGVPGTLLSWFAEASRFSHQQRLTSQVAELLGGEKPAAHVAKADLPAEPPPSAPALPDTTFKKLEVPLMRTTRLAAGSGEATAPGTAEVEMIVRERAAPPHGPPRLANVS